MDKEYEGYVPTLGQCWLYYRTGQWCPIIMSKMFMLSWWKQRRAPGLADYEMFHKLITEVVPKIEWGKRVKYSPLPGDLIAYDNFEHFKRAELSQFGPMLGVYKMFEEYRHG